MFVKFNFQNWIRKIGDKITVEGIKLTRIFGNGKEPYEIDSTQTSSTIDPKPKHCDDQDCEQILEKTVGTEVATPAKEDIRTAKEKTEEYKANQMKVHNQIVDKLKKEEEEINIDP